MTITKEQADEIRALHANGATFSELSSAYGIGKSSVKNIVKFRTHAAPGEAELRPRYVSTTIPADMYLKIEEYAAKQQIDMSTAVLRLLQFSVKMNRAFSSKASSEATPEPSP